jgi:hypothetical protein
MLFWIRWSEEQNQPSISQGPTFRIQDPRIPKAFLMNYSLSSPERARELQTTHMSLGSGLDFDLFDLGKATYEASLGSLFLSSLSAGEISVLEDLGYRSKHEQIPLTHFNPHIK